MPRKLWSIENAARSPLDLRDLVAAWRPDRAGYACRADGSPHPPGSCGPLYAKVFALPKDAEGRPRFVVDAGYAQLFGATIGAQTSVWRWDSAAATLLWISWHDIMIDQRQGTSFHHGVLSIGEKEEYTTFASCGGCEGRQVYEQLRITPTHVSQLAKRPAKPELDTIDHLLSGLSHQEKMAKLASPQVIRVLRYDLKRDGQLVDGASQVNFGLFDTSEQRAGASKLLCFSADELAHTYTFKLKSSGSRVYLAHVSRGPAGGCRDPSSKP